MIEQAKEKASIQAINEQVTSDLKVIGIGSGSTIVYAVKKLGELHRKKVVNLTACIPSSFQAQQLIIENGLPLGTLNQYPGKFIISWVATCIIFND